MKGARSIMSRDLAQTVRPDVLSPLVNVHGVGLKQGRRVLCMGVVKGDDGDIYAAMRFHHLKCRHLLQLEAWRLL